MMINWIIDIVEKRDIWGLNAYISFVYFEDGQGKARAELLSGYLGGSVLL